MTKPDVVPDTVVDTTALAKTPSSGTSLIERLLFSDGTTAENAIAKLEGFNKFLTEVRRMSIAATYPTDWVIHTSTSKTGEVLRQVGYLQDVGAARAAKLWGIEVGEVTVEKENHEDGTYTYKLEAPAWSKLTGERIDQAFGSRWSGDQFFVRNLREGEKVDPSDVAKAAYANLHGRAVRELGGLGGVPLETLVAAGLAKERLVFVGYDSGARGGDSTGAGVGSADVKIGFGRSSGKTPKELDDKDLDYYLGAYERNVADPSRERFKKDNERVLAALKAEKARRDELKTQDGATGRTPTEAPKPGNDGQPTTRGEKIGLLNERLVAAVKDKRKALPLLRAVTKDLFETEIGSFQDLSDEQIDKLLQVDEPLLAKVAEALIKATEPK